MQVTIQRIKQKEKVTLKINLNYFRNLGYYKLNKDQQYCKLIISPKIIKAREKLNKYYKR